MKSATVQRLWRIGFALASLVALALSTGAGTRWH